MTHDMQVATFGRLVRLLAKFDPNRGSNQLWRVVKPGITRPAAARGGSSKGQPDDMMSPVLLYWRVLQPQSNRCLVMDAGRSSQVPKYFLPNVPIYVSQVPDRFMNF